jgi:hypothetical protein
MFDMFVHSFVGSGRIKQNFWRDYLLIVYNKQTSQAIWATDVAI